MPHTNLKNAETKKNGAGGRNWGNFKDDVKASTTSLDEQDPNYQSDEEPLKNSKIIMNSTEIVAPTTAILQEYLFSGDYEEAGKSLIELELNESHGQFVKKALVIGMEHKAFERELISKLLSNLYSQVIKPERIQEGFQNAIDFIDDLVLDTPDAVEVLAKFLARAIVDEIVPPAFLKVVEATTPQAKEVIALANGLTTEKHRIDRLAHVWGPGDLSSVKRLKEEVSLLLQEFIINGDYQEADKSVRNLNAPSFYFQLVKQAVRLAIQSTNPEERKKISNLLDFFYKEGLISVGHMERGFCSCLNSLGDLALDVPNAESLLSEVIHLGKQAGYLPQDFIV